MSTAGRKRTAEAAVALLIGSLAACGDSGARAPRVNLLLVTLDTTRADHLGCYGYSRDTSPNLDRLAGVGVRFERAVSQAAVTPVSHASIFTGANPYSHGLRVFHGLGHSRLPEEQTTLAEILQRNAYQTAAFVSAFPVSQRFGLDQGFETFDADFLAQPVEEIVNERGIVATGRNQRGARETTDRALAWLEGASAPFFLWVHYFDPHDPKLRPPAEFAATRPWRRARPSSLPERLRELYDLEIRYMDAQIGRLLHGLQTRDDLGKTLVVVVADHGEGLGQHHWWTHGLLYDEQLRVPLILEGPGVPVGRVLAPQVRSIDIMPTVLELLGLGGQVPPGIDGRSLVTLFGNGVRGPEPVAYADSLNTLTYVVAAGLRDVKDDVLFAVSRGGWKYIHHALRPRRSELYHLSEDPGELHNLLAERPGRAREMRRLLASLPFEPATPETGPISRPDAERLRALGYVDSHGSP